ncbi:SusC/RagA family TonB-linked outer membrane protein [Flavobacterium columnare]|nr:SusC/RagA family TonB-linked outer membrane protein [Flavobacterium columnare]MBF6655090.1 SusC/RagA family TonB-linked outer membrane protein [Flavobacterium columnare]MBF6657784.1 SusC/RagA family TonB-linked outer membrane protein [Flavobacterium columnare]
MRSKFKWIFTLLLALTMQFSFAQEKTITGVVTDANGPLPGVNVVVKGTQRGVSSGFDGKYSIKAKEGETLVFSFMGMREMSKVVGASNVINTVMQSDAKQFGDVVIVAYGTQKKQAVTGSIKTIDNKEIVKSQSANVLQSLSGKVSGVQITTNSGQPGDAPQVRFRGIGSISSSNTPLYVVDGVPYNGNINAISNQDIESVTFLKDASANALYGSRGANGVIILTTKKAVKGKTQIVFDTKVGVSSRAVKEYDVITDPGEYYELYFERLRQGNLFNGQNFTTATNNALNDLINSDLGLVYNVYNVPDNKIIDATTGKLNPNAKLLYQDSWYDELFRQNLRSEYNLTVSNATDKASTFFSLGYLKDNGYLINSGFTRLSGRLKNDYSITDNFKVSANVNYARTQRDAPNSQTGNNSYSNVFGWARNIAPIYPIWARNSDGSIAYGKDGKIYDFGTVGGYMGLARPYAGNLNAYAKTDLDQVRDIENNLSGRFSASWDFIKDFNFTYNFSADLLMGNYNFYGNAIGGDYVSTNGSLTNATTFDQTLTNQQLLSWKKTLGKHTLDLMVGHESSEYKSKMLEATKVNIILPGQVYLSNASKVTGAAGYNDNYNVEGYLSKFGYAYDNKYFFNGSFRRDGSSVFSPDNRWGNFFGFGLGYQVSNESFLKNNEVITNLKLKASYGQQGNDALLYASNLTINHRNYFGKGRNYYAYMSQYENVSDANGNMSILKVYEGNKDLRWEVSKNSNVGLEVELFNRFSIDAEVFERKVSDLLFNFPLALSTGTATIPKNIGNMSNRGIEVGVKLDAIKNSKLTWTLSGNTTYYKNKIDYLPSSFTSGNFKFEEGLPAYEFYLREFAGVNQTNGNAQWYKHTFDANGNVVDKTVTETLSAATLYKTGKSALPKFYGGFGTSVSYSGFNLGVNFGYQFGGYMFDGNYASLMSSGTSDPGRNFHKDIYNTWTVQNPTAPLPAIDKVRDNNWSGTSDIFLIKSDYISLEDVSLTYDFNKKFLPKSMSSLTMALYGTNLALWSKRQGLDPRLSNIGNSQATNGQSLNKYQAQRTFSFGLTAKF